MSSDKYTISVSGEKLTFTREQLQSEPESWFATFFFGSFAEAAQGVREITIEKDTRLFKLIQAHLRGYVVLPLADAAIPPYMTKETALINLQREARYYGLKRLEEEIEEFRRILQLVLSVQRRSHRKRRQQRNINSRCVQDYII